MDRFTLNGKTAFVVGGLGLIGREVCMAFAEYGSRLVILDSNDNDFQFEKKIKKFNQNVDFSYFDCSDMDNQDENFLKLIKKYGCPDIYINCSYPRNNEWSKSSFKESTLESFRENIDIHLNSYSWLARLVAETMVKSKKCGSIIQLSSIYGILGQDLNIYEGTAMKENIAYSAIKGGIINFTRQMASYYGKYDIRINNLVPGGLVGHSVADINNKQDPIFVKQYSNKVPLKRLGKAEEVASTAVFLASNASSYITGSTIMVDGGWSIV